MDGAGPPREGLAALDYFGVAIYLVATFFIVLRGAKKQASTEDFFVGGRRMPWFAVGLSVMATVMSTISYVGLPGEMMGNGITLFVGYLAFPLCFAVVALLWIPFFMRLRLTSAYEYLERRFSYGVRLLGGVLFLFLKTGWMSLVVYVAALALEQMTGWSIDRVILVVGAIAVVYTAVGGMHAIIWTDVLQYFMLLGGALSILVYVGWTTGSGPSAWWSAVAAKSPSHVAPALYSLDITERMTIVTAMISWFFWHICTHGSDQVVLQRYFSTSSIAAARKCYLVNLAAEVSTIALLAVSGFALLYFYLDYPDYLPSNMSRADKFLPYFFAHQLPAGLGGFILAGFLCDAMQTLDSGVNSITAVVTKDLFERLYPAGSRWLSELSLARILTVIIGCCVTVLALGIAASAEQRLNIVDLMPKTFNMFLGPLATLFIAGMFIPRCTSRSIIPAVVLSLAASFVWSYWKELAAAFRLLALASEGNPAWDQWQEIMAAQKPLTITLAVAVPLAVGMASAYLLSIIVDRGGAHPGCDFTWRAVMRRAQS